MFFFKKKEETKIIQFPKEILIKNKNFKIKVDLINKKSSSVNIKENTLNFRLSNYLNNKEIEKHFNELLKKIIIKIEKNNYTQKIEKKFKEVLEKGKFIFSNETYLFEYYNKRTLKLENNTFYIPIKHSLNYDYIKKSIIKLLINKYSKRIETYLEQLNKQTYNYQINGFHLNDVSSKWGHCTYDNKIMLNLKLLNAPTDVLNYVIIHEISHIKHKNHSKNFWKEVEKHCPNYKNLRQYLKYSPPTLFN